MFKEYDVVALKREVAGVPAGEQGTIVMVWSAASREYEVEFGFTFELAMKGVELLQYTHTLHEDDLMLISPASPPEETTTK